MVSDKKIFKISANENTFWLISVQRFQRRRFKCEKLTDGRRMLTHDKSSHGLWPGELKNQPIRNKNRLWRPCLLIDRDEMSKPYRGPSIDASYQVSVHLAKGFQRRRLKCEVNRRWTPSDGKSSHCLWQGELMTCSPHALFYLCNNPQVQRCEKYTKVM